MLCNPGSLCLVIWELWNHFFRRKELERLTPSAGCARHCLAHQAEDFVLASHGDIPPLLAQVFVPGTADVVSGTELPLLLPLHCRHANKLLRAEF